jgi:hypothetical protein
MGYESMGVTSTGCKNVAVGANSLVANTTGNFNTAIGKSAFERSTTATCNTGVGLNALEQLTTGASNVSIGRFSGADAMINLTTENNRGAFGHNNITNAYVKVAWTVTSDQRDKTNFGTVPHGLDFVNQLEPVSFQFRKSREDDTPHGDLRYGFKAQDIMALEGDNPVIIDNEFEDALKYKGEHLVPVLVNAIKELTETNKDLKSRIEALESN